MTHYKDLSIKNLDSGEISRRGLWAWLWELAARDPARHYFILLGLLSPEKTYERIILAEGQEGKLQGAFLRRRSGNAQLMLSRSLAEGKPSVKQLTAFAEEIRRVGANQLITAVSYGDALEPFNLFETHQAGAEIAVLSSEGASALKDQRPGFNAYEITALRPQDLEEVIYLYERCFHSFTPKAVMAEKLLSGRGHGILLRNSGKLVGCAQSEFESPEHALIVGVATDPEFRGKGIATLCVTALVNSLILPGRDFALQYDNPGAGRIYQRLGFAPVDQVGHYTFRKDV